jgi:flagellar biosynthetic protein FliR
MPEWSHFLSAMTLVMVRVSGIVAFAPFFSSTALPVRAKAVFTLAVAYLLAPLVASLPYAQAEIGFAALMGELAVGLIYGLTIALLNEMLLFAGQIVGLQFSFSLVNLLDPASSIQTPLLGELFQLMGTLVVITAGLDRVLLASMCGAFMPYRWEASRWRLSPRPESCTLPPGFFSRPWNWLRRSWPQRYWWK